MGRAPASFLVRAADFVFFAVFLAIFFPLAFDPQSAHYSLIFCTALRFSTFFNGRPALSFLLRAADLFFLALFFAM